MPQDGIVRDLTAELGEVKLKTAAALHAAQGDPQASRVLVAVVREFDTKADKATAGTDGGGRREAVVELEQAGDSAKVAAEADKAAAGATRQIVLDAHLAICMLKASM